MAKYGAVVFLLGPGTTMNGRDYLYSKGIDTPGELKDGRGWYTSRVWGKIDLTPIEDRENGILYCPVRPGLCGRDGELKTGMLTDRIYLYNADMFIGVGTCGANHPMYIASDVLLPEMTVSSERLANLTDIRLGVADPSLREALGNKLDEIDACNVHMVRQSRSVQGMEEAYEVDARQERFRNWTMGSECQDMEMVGLLDIARKLKTPAAGTMVVADNIVPFMGSYATVWPDGTLQPAGESTRTFDPEKTPKCWAKSLKRATYACLDAAEKVAREF